MQDMDKERKTVNTEVSIHPEIEDRISKFQKDCLIDEIESLPPIKEGDVNISTDFIFDIGDKYEVSIFIRNGLQKPINFENVPFLIVDKDNQVLGSKIFNLREVGEIPPCSVRPWKIFFDKSEINLEEKNLKELKIVFDTRIKAEKTVKIQFENLPEGIQGEPRRKFEKFLENLPLLREGQVSMSTYDVTRNNDDSISTTIIIRNGSNNEIKVEKVPLTIIDANDNTVAAGLFYLDNVTISPRKAKVYNFSFSKEEIMIEDLDLSSWKVNYTLDR